MAGAGERAGRLSVVAKRLRADYFSLKKTDSESDDLLSPTFLGANSEPLCAGASAIRARNFTGMQHAKPDLSTLLTKRWNVLEFKQGTGDGAGNCGRAVGRLLKAKIHQQGGRQAVRGCDARMLPFLQECRSRSGAAPPDPYAQSEPLRTRSDDRTRVSSRRNMRRPGSPPLARHQAVRSSRERRQAHEQRCSIWEVLDVVFQMLAGGARQRVQGLQYSIHLPLIPANQRSAIQS